MDTLLCAFAVLYRQGAVKHPQSCVEYSGLEPLTSTLPVSRSSQMS